MGPGRLLIGTSGWSYASWRGVFYPVGLPVSEQLDYLSHRTSATEVNASFYRLQRPPTFRSWFAQAPDEHVFSVKGSRYVTHLKQLRDPETALANLLASGVLELGTKLDVMLWQLPARLSFRPEPIEEFLRVLPRTTGEAAALAGRHDDRLTEDQVVLEPRQPEHRLRHALEPRHPSFGTDEAAALLAEYDVAMVDSDSAGTWPRFERDTAGFRYVRLHGHTQLYTSRYTDAELDAWAERCLAWTGSGQDVHVYFDNDSQAHAPRDALRLLDRLPAG